HVAGQRVAGGDFRPGVDVAGEGGDGFGGVPGRLHADEGLQAQADPLRVEFGAVAGDHPFALQPLQPAQAGRGRQVHALGQFGIGLAAGALEFGQQLQVDAIEFGCRHFVRWTDYLRMNIALGSPIGATSQSFCAFARIGWRYRLPCTGTAMSVPPRRIENIQTDRGSLPVYATGTVEQPWDGYTAEDHDVWRRLYQRQREILPGRASDAFLRAQDTMGMTPDRIPRFDELNKVLGDATGWRIVGVEGLLPELVFFDHLANRRFPVSWWIRRPDQIDYIEEPDLFHDLFGHVPLLMDPMFADYLEAYGKGGVKAHAVGPDALMQL